jgi:hypothetical protein
MYLCRCSLSASVIAMLLAAGLGVAADDGKKSPEKPAAQGAKPADKPAAKPAEKSTVRYRPATTTASSVRVTGGSRGAGDAALSLDVLAPDEVGTTTMAQPSLFWFQSKPAEATFELTLLQDGKVKPLVHVMVERSTKAGIQRVKLADHNVQLTPGIEYQWVVALITDPNNRSSDLVASGVIKRVEPSAELKQKVSGASADALAGVYAESGIWYDALAVLCDQIDAKPGDKALRQARVDLLKQVGLPAAAAFEEAALASHIDMTRPLTLAQAAN